MSLVESSTNVPMTTSMNFTQMPKVQMQPSLVMKPPQHPHPCLLLQEKIDNTCHNCDNGTSCTCSYIMHSMETTAYRQSTKALTDTMHWSCPKLNWHSLTCSIPIFSNQEATIPVYHRNIHSDHPPQMTLMMPWLKLPLAQPLKCCIEIICYNMAGWLHAAAHNGTSSYDNLKVALPPSFAPNSCDQFINM